MTNGTLCWVQGLCAHKPNDNIPHHEMIVITFYCIRNSPTLNKKKRKQWKATKESRSSNKTNYCQSQVRVPLIVVVD